MYGFLSLDWIKVCRRKYRISKKYIFCLTKRKCDYDVMYNFGYKYRGRKGMKKREVVGVV